MFIITGAALLIGLAVGYFFGVQHQSMEEVVLDCPREPDYETIQSEKWVYADPEFDLDFLRTVRMTDAECETVHNVPLSLLIRQSGDVSKRAVANADRVFLDAVKVDRKTGRVVRVILHPGRKANNLIPLLRKARIRVSVEEPKPI